MAVHKKSPSNLDPLARPKNLPTAITAAMSGCAPPDLSVGHVSVCTDPCGCNAAPSSSSVATSALTAASSTLKPSTTKSSGTHDSHVGTTSLPSTDVVGAPTTKNPPELTLWLAEE